MGSSLKSIVITILLSFLLVPSAFARDYMLVSAPPSIWVQEEGGRLVGPLIELLGEVFSELEITMRAESMTWARAISHMESGELDMIPVIFYTDERTRYMDFSEPYAEVSTSIFTPIDSAFTFNSFDDLVGKNGLIMRGDSISPEFKENRYRLNLSEVSSYKQMVTMLAANRADYAVAAQYGFIVQIKQLNREREIKVLPRPVASRSLHLAFSKKSRYSSLLPKINKHILQMQKNGRLDEMIGETLERAAGR